MAANLPVRVRDFRRKAMYQMDDEYMNGYARLCGWKGTIVYSSLCRHANKDQYSFPSINLMAAENGVSRPTIVEGVKALEKWNVIRTSQSRTSQGTFRNSGYDLLDKSEWMAKPEANQVNHIDSAPSQRRLLYRVNVVDSKDTHIKDTSTNVDGGIAKKQPSCPVLKNLSLQEKYPGGHNECVEYVLSYEEYRKVKFINRSKQFKLLHKILSAGFDFYDADSAICKIEKKYGENSWDFSTVVAWLEKGAVHAQGQEQRVRTGAG